MYPVIMICLVFLIRYMLWVLWGHLKPALHPCYLNIYGIIWGLVSLYNESSQNRAIQAAG